MNGGDGPTYFDRGSRYSYGRPWRRLNRGPRVFQTPGATPAYSNKFLAQFAADTRRLGQTLCATSLGNTVLDLSACLLPGWWSAGTSRRGFPSASRVRRCSTRGAAGTWDSRVQNRSAWYPIPPPRPLQSRLTLCQAPAAPRLATPSVRAPLHSLPSQAASLSAPRSHRRGNAPFCARLPRQVSP